MKLILAYLKIVLDIVLIVHQRFADGQACNWPAEIQGTWTDSLKGEMLFSGGTVTGWSFTMMPNDEGGTPQVRDSWQCVSTEMFDSDGYLVMKTTERIQQFDKDYTAYRCLQMTKITNSSYRYYQIEPPQKRVQFERLNVITNDAETDVIVLCNHTNGASGSEFQIMVSTGNEASTRVRCPYNFVSEYDYTYTASDGSTTCQSTVDNWDMCSNNSEVVFNYGTCNTRVAYSVSETVWCMDNVPVGANMYVMLYNHLDDDGVVNNANVFRFSCMGVSADHTQVSITPQHCKANQLPDTVPVDNSGTSVGATLTLTSTAPNCPPCPVPADPQQGSVTIATSGATTTAAYACDAAHTMYGSPTRECLTDGTWSLSSPTCTCEPPVTPSNGTVTVATDASITATYTCDIGYVLIGNSIRTCITTSNAWTGSDPICGQCQDLPVLANGNITIETTGTTTRATYTCAVNYTLNGVPVRTCQTDTTWDSASPMCTSCQTLTSPSSGTIYYDTSGTVTTATVTCMDNYTMYGVSLLACRADGTWDSLVPECVCDQPISPANGSVTVSTDGLTATYTCYLYTTLAGPSTRICQGGGAWWDGADPTCVQCSLKSQPPGGTVVVTTDGVTTSAGYMCGLGYSMDGLSTVRCQTDGTWETVDAVCNECDPLTPPSSGSVELETDGTATSAAYTCAAGTTISGGSAAVCQSNGSWSMNAMSIDCVGCDSLALISGGSFSVTTNGIQSTVTFSCTSGYDMNGQSTATCESDGTWDSIEPSCVAMEDTGSGSNPLMAAVIALAMVAALLLVMVLVSCYIIAKMKRKLKTTLRMNKMIQGYNQYYGDPGMKEIPIASVPPQHAPRSHEHRTPDITSLYSRSATFHQSGTSRETTSTTLGALSPTKSVHFSRPIHSAKSVSSLGKVKFDLMKDSTTTSIVLNNAAPWNKNKRNASKRTIADTHDSGKH